MLQIHLTERSYQAYIVKQACLYLNLALEDVKYLRKRVRTGLIGMLLGTLVISEGWPWVLYFPIAVVALDIKVSSEERLLKETFGEEYIQYQQRVPQLVPGLKLLTRHQ